PVQGCSDRFGPDLVGKEQMTRDLREHRTDTFFGFQFGSQPGPPCLKRFGLVVHDFPVPLQSGQGIISLSAQGPDPSPPTKTYFPPSHPEHTAMPSRPFLLCLAVE